MNELLAVEAILMKAAGLGVDDIVFNIEQRLLAALRDVWLDVAQHAIHSAMIGYHNGSSQQTINDSIRSYIEAINGGIRAPLTSAVRLAYSEGKRAIQERIARKAKVPSIETRFSLQDENAIDSIINGQLRWVDEFYDDELATAIDEIVGKAMLETGLGRAEAGRLLESRLVEYLSATGLKVPWVGKAANYFEIVAANAANSARVRGSIGQMSQVGVTSYAIVAAGDEKTCDRCIYMDGRVFQTSYAMQRMAAIDEATDPEQMRIAYPWANKMSDMESNPSNFPFPPYHGSCRCAIDVTEEAEISFER